MSATLYERFSNALTLKQFEKVVRGKCLLDLRRVEFIAEYLIQEIQKIKDHHERDTCRCTLCSHKRRTDPGLFPDIVETSSMTIWHLNFLVDLISTNMPGGYNDFQFEMTVERLPAEEGTQP